MANKQTRTKQQWLDIQTAFEQSGLSQAVFCKQNQIPLSSFCRWRKILSEENEQPENSLVKINRPANFITTKMIIETDFCKIILNGTESQSQLIKLFQALKASENAC